MKAKQAGERTTIDDVAFQATRAVDDVTSKAKRAGNKIAAATHVAATTVGEKVKEGGSSAARKMERAAYKLEKGSRALGRKVEA